VDEAYAIRALCRAWEGGQYAWCRIICEHWDIRCFFIYWGHA
jgi:hypothetical protein